MDGTSDNPDETRVIRPRPSARSQPAATASGQPASAQPASAQPAFAQPSSAQPAPAQPGHAARPGGAALVPGTRPAQERSVEQATSDVTLSAAPGQDSSSLLPFAMPLLQLLAQLRTANRADPAHLRDRTAAALHAFESRATQAGRPADLVRRGHYALCDSLDDAVLNTPWGAQSVWTQQGMVASFHPAIGPGRFFDALRQAEAKADTMRPVLELLVVCLSLGMLGPYRDRSAEAEAIRTGAIAVLLAHTPPAPAGLAATWKGVDAPFRRARPRLPVWVAAVTALAIAGGASLLLGWRSNEAGDALFARMLAVPPVAMPELARDAPPPPPPPPPAEPAMQDRLRTRLAPQIAAGLVEVAGSPTMPILRLPARALFAAGLATPGAEAEGLLRAVADAIRPEGGRARVIGYADDRPVRTVQFPSSFKLTEARAAQVAGSLSQALGVPPFQAEGRAGADPVAPNTTPEGREQNRRIEIVMQGASP